MPLALHALALVATTALLPASRQLVLVRALMVQAPLHQALAVVARAEASLVADTQAVAVVTLVEEDK